MSSDKTIVERLVNAGLFSALIAQAHTNDRNTKERCVVTISLMADGATHELSLVKNPGNAVGVRNSLSPDALHGIPLRVMSNVYPFLLYPMISSNDCSRAGLRNGEYNAAERAGSLGGVVDDLYQDYSGQAGSSYTTSLDHKPADSLSSAQVTSKYGPIESWDVSQCTNMKWCHYTRCNYCYSE